MRKLMLYYLMLLAVAVSGQQKTVLQAKSDSTLRAWQQEYEARAAIRREQFLIELDTLSDTIRSLKMANLLLTELPEIGRFQQLEELRISNHRIDQIKKEQLAGLSPRLMVLENCSLKKLSIPRNRQLEVLSLNNNQLKRIPRSIRKQKNLKVLDLERNKIKRIPLFIKRMDHLEEINLSMNAVRLNRRAIRRLSKLETILLGGNQLQTLPQNIHKLKTVKRLNLGKNQLRDLPSSFSRLHQLEHLIFYENKFELFPPEVLALKQLKELDFYYNQLTEVPDGLGGLSHLQQLFLSYNRLSKLPDTLAALKNLRYLYAHNNEIVLFPDWIASHPKLERVGLGKNKIINLPELSKMGSLTDLNLQENLIDRFPWELLEKEGLQLLQLKDNPLLLTPSEITQLKAIAEDKAKNGFTVVF